MLERNARRFWILFVLGFFAIDFTIAIVAISMAASDPSFRSIPGFGERSVHWDDWQQKQRVLDDLGWKIELDRERTDKEKLRLRIVDRDGQRVKVAQLSLKLFHYTRVAEQQSAKCNESDDGYEADIQLQKPGLWNMDIEGVTADGKQFWTQQTIRWEMEPVGK